MKIKLESVLLSILLLLVLSCTEKLNITEELSNNFNNQQIEDLDKILNFFKNQVCEDSIGFETCIKNMAQDLSKEGYYFIGKKIDYSKQKKLYENIDQLTFNSIWSFCKTTDINKDITYDSLCFNVDGVYGDFLKQVSVKNSFYKFYYEGLINSGDFGSNGKLMNEIIKNKNSFDFEDYNNQLIISIEYLTLSDQQKRKP